MPYLLDSAVLIAYRAEQPAALALLERLASQSVAAILAGVPVVPSYDLDKSGIGHRLDGSRGIRRTLSGRDETGDEGMSGSTTLTPTERVHRQAVAAPLTEIAGLLQTLLSRRLTAYIAGVKDGKTVTRWANGDIAEIRQHDIEQRLRTAYEIAQLLLTGDAPQTVRAWFLGLNPQLSDVAPAEAIHEGHLKAAISAARAFAVDFAVADELRESFKDVPPEAVEQETDRALAAPHAKPAGDAR